MEDDSAFCVTCGMMMAIATPMPRPKHASGEEPRPVTSLEEVVPEDSGDLESLSERAGEAARQAAAESREAVSGALNVQAKNAVEQLTEEVSSLEKEKQAARDAVRAASQEAEDVRASAKIASERIRRQAAAEAEMLRGSAREEADSLLAGAREEADRLVREAKAEAEGMLAGAQEEASKLRSTATGEASTMKEQAEKELADARARVEQLHTEAGDEADTMALKAQEEGRRIREKAYNDAEEILRTAKQEAADVKARAADEAHQMKTKATQESAQLKAAAAAEAQKIRSVASPVVKTEPTRALGFWKCFGLVLLLALPGIGLIASLLILLFSKSPVARSMAKGFLPWHILLALVCLAGWLYYRLIAKEVFEAYGVDVFDFLRNWLTH